MKLERIRGMREVDGRPLGVFYSIMALQMPMRGGRHVRGESQQERHSLNVQKSIDDCGHLASLGVTDTWVPPPIVDSVDEYLHQLHVIASEVMPVVRQIPAETHMPQGG